QHPQLACDRRVVANYGAAVAIAAQVLGWIEAEGADVAHRTREAGAKSAPMGLRSVFDDENIRSDALPQRRDIDDVSEHMDRPDRPGFRRGRGRDLIEVH